MTGDVVGWGRGVRRRLRETTCPGCGHAWEGHPGGLVGVVKVCGECEDECHVDGAPVDRAPCRVTVPDAVFTRPTPRERGRARPLSHRIGSGIGRALARLVDGLLNAWP